MGIAVDNDLCNTMYRAMGPLAEVFNRTKIEASNESAKSPKLTYECLISFLGLTGFFP